MEIKNALILDYITKYNINREMFDNDIKISNIIDELILQKNIIIEEEVENLKKIKLENSILNTINTENRFEFITENSEDEIEDQVINDNDVLNVKLIENENIKNINSDIQKLYYYLIVEKILNLNYPVYLPHFLDFRGRVYPNSSMGFTNLKFIRALFQLKSELKNDELKNSQYFKKIINENVSIDHYFSNKIKNEIDKYFLIVLLLELGKINKGRITKAEGNILNDFINLGTDLYFKPADIKSEDLAYYLNIKKCIDNFLLKQEWEDVLIIRDSTGSSFQHWGIILGIQDDAFEKLNLDGFK